MFYLVKSPWLLKKFYPGCIWNIATNEKILYLTFDDGPHPQATSFVLDELKKHHARATFFCIGKNVKDHFDIYKQILLDGHRVGNHTYDHLNGWRTDDKVYFQNIEKAKRAEELAIANKELEFQNEEKMSVGGLTCFTRRLHEIDLKSTKLYEKNSDNVRASVLLNVK